jgi:hypothetical protein
MKVRKIIFITILVLFFCSNVGGDLIFTYAGQADRVWAEDEYIDEDVTVREYRIERLNKILRNRDDITALVPGVVVKDGPGGPYVEYNGTRIEKLDDDILGELVGSVNNILVIKNVENIQRIQRDIRNIQRIQDLNRQQRMIQQHQSIRGYQPPARPPSPPAQPPRAPSQPPRR